jgi:glutathione S-transferase
MKLYGTTTSPFVRRVRVVADEIGQAYELFNTAPDDGQARLREVSPIRKVPVADIDGRTIYDSRVIIDYLTLTRGWGTVVPARDRWHEQNLLNAIDGAIDAMISLFYLRRDGIAVDGSVFATRQTERADAIFAWIAPQLSTETFGLPEISVCCALDWMEFRKAYDTTRAAGLSPVREAWSTRMAATRPHA